MVDQVQDILHSLDMTSESGLVFTDQRDNVYNLSETLALDLAYRLGARAVYFRRFPKTSEWSSPTSLPQVYIYDVDFDDSELLDLHRKLWSSGNVPFFYVITKTQVKIFSCTQKAKSDSQGNLKIKPLEILSVASALVKSYDNEKFSAKLFDNGALWQQEEYAHLLDPKNSPYETLLEGLLAAKNNLMGQAEGFKISEPTISKLLIMCILVKYLEEKIDDNGIKLFSLDRDFLPQFGEVNQPIEQFTDVLRQGHAISFFDILSRKFSGEVFNFSNAEKQELQIADLSFIANIFDAKVRGAGQYVLWELYSFNHLPIELISGIYEAFLKEGQSKPKGNKGVVYTPPYLVNFLIDECMPLDKAEEYFKDENFKILDPACGSGIFLVSAFKRMIQWKAIINYKLSGKVEYPNLETVKRIIRNNIHGVDIEQEATRLTIFSLCIAICEKLSPMQIWNDLQFDDLSRDNIKTNNFFAYIGPINRQSFDLVIGNPPFNPPFGKSNREYFNELVKEYQIQTSAPINDNNLALLFLDRCMRFPKHGKQICLIVPSGAWLYNNNSQDYRTHFIKTHTVKKIIDFTHLSDVLFYGRANIAVCVVIATNETPIAKLPVMHLVVHRAKVAEKRYYFEIDHYDFNYIRHQSAVSSIYVWKSNLLGGGRLLRLIERLQQLETVQDFLDEKKQDGWINGEGYIISDYKDRTPTELLEAGFHPADYITNQQVVVTDNFAETGIGQTDIEKAKYFLRPRNRLIYQPPHVLIKENLGKESIPIVFSDEYLCFKHKVIGIHAPGEQRADLVNFFERFKANNSLYRFFLTSTSGQAGISLSSSVLLKTDIMNLPFSVDQEDMTLSPNEEIVRNDVSTYLHNISQTTSSSPLFSAVSDEVVHDFGEVFCHALNPVYESYTQKWQVDSYTKNERFIGYAFCYGQLKEHQIVDWQEDSSNAIYNLIYNETQRNTRITRVVRTYLHIEGYDLLILIKPNLLRYWLKSTALRDTDETFADLKRAGF